jgi:hypothetical protein
LSTLTPSSSLLKIILYQIFTGIFAGQTMQLSILALQAGSKKEFTAVVTGLRSGIRLIGGSIGLTVSATIM